MQNLISAIILLLKSCLFKHFSKIRRKDFILFFLVTNFSVKNKRCKHINMEDIGEYFTEQEGFLRCQTSTSTVRLKV